MPRFQAPAPGLRRCLTLVRPTRLILVRPTRLILPPNPFAEGATGDAEAGQLGGRGVGLGSGGGVILFLSTGSPNGSGGFSRSTGPPNAFGRFVYVFKVLICPTGLGFFGLALVRPTRLEGSFIL